MFDVGRRRLPAALIRPAIVCALAAIATGGSWVLAQEPRPALLSSVQEQDQSAPFRGGVDLIQLVVSVLDEKREPVRGLTAADFTIRDEGLERPVRAFTPVDLPGNQAPAGVAAWTRDVAPDIATNQVGDQPGRLVVILMDRSIPVGQPTITARAIAAAAIDELGPDDLAALVTTTGGVPQNFTADRSRLLRAIDQRDWSTGISKDAEALPTIGKQDSLSDGRCLCGVCVFDTVRRVAEAVRDTPGRSKSLFFIGSGLVIQVGPRPPNADTGCDRLVRVERQKMLDAIDLSNLTVHSIDPNGLASVGPQTRAGTPGDTRGLPEGQAAALRRAAHQAETNEVLAMQGSLRVLPDLTGGRTIVNRNMPDEMVPAVFRESASYYLLGFEAPPGARDDGPRSLEVKVARRGVSVSTRRRYLPPSPAAPGPPASSGATTGPASPGDSMSGLLPDAHPPLTMALAVFASPDGPDGIVNVSVDAAAFVADADSSIPLDMLVTAVDQTGRPVASAKQTSAISGRRPASRPGSAIDVPTHLSLPPGDYEVRVALTDTARGTTASVFSQVLVPAFASERLSLSDIVLERVAEASKAPTPFPDVVPITARSFERSDRVQASVQVYQGTQRQSALLPISVETRVTDTQNRVVSATTETLAPEAFLDRRVDDRTILPLPTLSPGEYLLSIITTAGGQTARRLLRFNVE